MSLMEELEIEDGAVVSDNFHRYPMLRMADVPTNIRVHLDGTSGHERINEIGEPPVGPVGPAIGNAIYAAIGKRIRSLPFRTADLTWS
jgi:isoquinoline 1-oxidoreductase beta subunit